MILESLRAAVVFLQRAWSRPWFVIVVAVTAAAGIAGLIAAGPSSSLSSVIVVAFMVFVPLVQGPLYTSAIDDAPPEPTVTDGGARYVRLVVVGLLTAIFLAVPALLIFVVGLGAAYGMAFANPGFDPANASTWTAGGPVLVGSAAVLGVGALSLLWLSSRVSLGAAATVAERRVLMISTWPLTRGAGWSLIVARLILSLVVVTPVAAAFSGTRSLAPTSAGGIASLTGLVLLVGLWAPLNVGALSYFYRHRSPLPTP